MKRLGDIRRQTPISLFRAKREIFVIRGPAVNDLKFQTGNLLSAYPRVSPHIYCSEAISTTLNPEVWKQGWVARDEWLGIRSLKWLVTWIRLSGIAPYIFAAKPPPSLLIPHSSLLIPHSSLLIPHLGRAFIPSQGTSRPQGQPWTLNPKLFSKKQLTQRRQYGKIIPIADEAAPFERALKKISKKSFDKPLRMW